MKKHKGLWMLFGISVLCLAPIVGAWILYRNANHFSFTHNNHGQFIHPARQASFLKDAIHGWTFVYFTEQCHDICQKTLYNLHQMRIALGKNAQRVSILLVEAQTHTSLKTAADARLPVNSQLKLQVQKLLADYPVGFNASNHLVLFDPQAFVVMYYSPDQPLTDIYQDLQHLFGVSSM
ncbi:MAG: hypothetical protein KIT27_00220 [Legionellales bacterium]|nr:hypothetical protein [Legionellales bacterium]